MIAMSNLKILEDSKMRDLKQYTLHILGKTEYNDIIHWISGILDKCRTFDSAKEPYIFVMTRKCESVLNLFFKSEFIDDIAKELSNIDKESILGLYKTKFIVEDSLFEQLDQLIILYKSIGKFPKIIIISEQLFHGRTINSLILRLIESMRIQCRNQGFTDEERDRIIQELKRNLKIEIYNKCSGVLLLMYEYAKDNKLNIYKESETSRFLTTCLRLQRSLQIQSISRLVDTWCTVCNCEFNQNRCIDTVINGYRQSSIINRFLGDNATESLINVVSCERILQDSNNNSLVSSQSILNNVNSERIISLFENLGSQYKLEINNTCCSDAYKIKYTILLLNAINLAKILNSLGVEIHKEDLNLWQLNRHYSKLETCERCGYKDMQLIDISNQLYEVYNAISELTDSEIFQIYSQINLHKTNEDCGDLNNCELIDYVISDLAVKDEQQAYNRYSTGLAFSSLTLANWGQQYSLYDLQQEVSKRYNQLKQLNDNDKFIQTIDHYLSLGYLERYYDFERITTGSNNGRAVENSISTMFKTS